VEDDKENKTGHQISFNQDNARNLERRNADTAHTFASPTPLKMKLKKKKLLPNSWKPPTNSNFQSTALKEHKSKQL
jgi:hypothetical protein